MPDRPRLLDPVDAPADAHALTLRWAPADPAVAPHVQIARDPGFADVAADVVLDGGADTLVLAEVLPEDGRTYHWRVGEGARWSPAAPFRATSDDAVAAWHQARRDAAAEAARDAERARDAAESARADAVAPHRVGTTSSSEAALFLYVLVASFAVTLFFIFRAFPGLQG